MISINFEAVLTLPKRNKMIQRFSEPLTFWTGSPLLFRFDSFPHIYHICLNLIVSCPGKIPKDPSTTLKIAAVTAFNCKYIYLLYEYTDLRAIER